MIIPFRDKSPSYGDELFVAPNAWVIGDVTLGNNVSIFFGAVLRGDILPIVVGDRSNLQENVTVHTSRGRTPTLIGNDVTIGHGAIVHGCSVGDRCLIGMGSILLDEAVIEPDCVVGAGALVTEKRRFPSGSLILGSPAKVARALTTQELDYLKDAAASYVRYGREYLGLKLG